MTNEEDWKALYAMHAAAGFKSQREIIATMVYIHDFTAAKGANPLKLIEGAFTLADQMIRYSRENPPKC